MNHFLLLGSHPLLSLAEARAVIGGEAPRVIESIALFDRSDWNGRTLQERLAGTIKTGDLIASYPLSAFSANDLADLIDEQPRGNKVVFGLSLFGTTKEKNRLKQLPIQLKRILQERDRSVRWFAGDQGTVSSAAVAKLDLIEKGYDFQIAVVDQTVYVGLTTAVQNLDAWSLRDFGRPFRDATTGMLPPKLARLLVNLAGAEINNKTLLDPFCGGGTILMEASLMGQGHLIGSDIDARQIGGSKQNLDWLVSEQILSNAQRDQIELHTHPVETLTTVVKGPIDTIVTEGFLGKPLNGNETLSWLEQQKLELETLWEKTFSTFANLQPKGGIVVATIPRHRGRGKTLTIDADPGATKHGYTRVSPLASWKASHEELIYARDDQRVERRICVWRKTG